MNFERIELQLKLDITTLQEIDITKDKRFVVWNQKKKNLFSQVNRYKNHDFRLPFSVQKQINQFKDSKLSKKTGQQSIRDQLTQIEPKQYKIKKITKLDKFHVKQKKQRGRIKRKTDDITAKTNLKRKKQLKKTNKKYKNKATAKVTGKKQPKQINKSTQKTKKKVGKKAVDGQRKNYQVRSLDQSSIIEQRRSLKKNVQKYSQSHEQIQKQEGSISSKQVKKRGRKKMDSLSKKYSSTTNDKNAGKFYKSSYLLQESSKNKQLYDKFNKQVLCEAPGRKDQAQRIFQLVVGSENGSATPICLHGNTGCGKTSLITKIINFINKQFPNNFSTAYLNCMTMWSVNHVYSGILYKLFGFKQKRSQHALNNLFQHSQRRAGFNKSSKKLPVNQNKDLTSQLQKTKIIVLDQIDHFIKDQSFIYNLLQWTHIKNSKIILIMISNILDLSVNLSAKIQSRLKFESLVFKPYSHEAIEQILKYKYPEAKLIFEPKAMTFMCRKVASINSDIRLLQKIYDDVITQWSELNGLTEGQSQNDIYSLNQRMSDQDGIYMELSQQKEKNKRKTKNLNYQNKKKTQMLIQLSKQKKITISQVQKSLFLTGQLNNEQLPEILKQYQVLLKVLHNAKKKEQVSYQIMNKTYLKQKKMPSSQEIFLLMCQLKDMGLIQIKQSTKSCDVTFQGFGIKINKQLHMMCPQE